MGTTKGDVSGAEQARRASPGALRLLVFFLTFLVYMSQIPALLRTSNPPTGDQAAYLMATISLATDGDLDVANNFARHDEDAFYSRAPHPRGYVPQSAPYPLPPDLILSPARPPTESYSYHPPGLGLLLVPAWIVGSWFHVAWPATVVFMCLVGALAGLNVFLLAYESAANVRIACVVWAALSFSAPLMCYSILIFSEVPASVLIIYSVRRFSADPEANRPWQWGLAGASVAFLPWLSWRCGVIAAALGFYGAVRWWRGRGAMATKRSSAVLLAGPILLSLAGIAGYARFLSGGWILDIRRRSGDVDVFHWPWRGGMNLRLFLRGLTGLFLDQQWGLLVHSPVYLLALAGLGAIVRAGAERDREQLRWLAIVGLPYLVLIAAFEHWGGLWCPPGRYLVPLVPLLALPLAVSLRDLGGVRLYRIVFVLLAGLGFGYVFLLDRDLHLMWPASRGFFWGWLSSRLPGQFDLREMLPAFAWPGDRHPWQAMGVLGVCAAVAVWVDVLAARRARDGQSTLVLTRIAALSLLACLWFMDNRDLLGAPRLVSGKRWTLTPRPLQPEGMAFLNGAVFVADYTGGSVWALQLETNSWSRLRPRAAGRELDFFHPGDVVARRNRLWILNNGPGSGALFEMSTDGEVVRQVPLESRTEIATGFVFGGVGLYLSDMRGGTLREYSLRGGEPVRSWSGSGINNPAGLAINGDGALFVAESSGGRVLEYDSAGRLVQRFEIGCNPRRLVLDEGWLDGCCDDGLFSVELRSGLVKRFRSSGAPFQHPESLARGDDHTLYVIDSGVLAAFRVQR